MTQFANLELLYNQFFNLADEIKQMIEEEDYSEAIIKLDYKDKLMKKLSVTQKTVIFSEEEKARLHQIEQKLQEKERENINYINKLRNEMGQKLKSTNSRVKMNSAYDMYSKKSSGVIVDISE